MAGAAVGLCAGLVVGGALGRIAMRLLFLARHDEALGLETSMGAIIGELTAGGTLFVAVFGAFFGLLLGLAYVLLRGLMPARLLWREALFTLGAGGLMLGLIEQTNREDFAILGAGLSLLLTTVAIVGTALPVPVLVERLAPDRPHDGRVAARVVLGLAGAAIAAYALLGVVDAYTV